ncbi:hypothetical protein [Azohydromonas aeria]|uniref:hypothetical protein n=1 Tax=Azohydromonas aeria TaxID=2590212 RepID=UPI0012F9C197|nr:hypothetical protein [Azohydromonas aeria]
MRTEQDRSSYEIKLTIAREECPGLHSALSAIREPRRRASRLRELAAKGLLLESHGLAAPPTAGMNPELQVPPTPETGPVAGRKFLGDVLEWDADAT